MKITDNSEMPVGKFQGNIMTDVPDNHLKELYGENKVLFQNGTLPTKMVAVMEYIEDSFNESEL